MTVRRTAFSLALVILLLLCCASCANLDHIRLHLDYPQQVQAGESFQVVAIVENSSEEDATLVAIDIADEVLDALLLENSDPMYISSSHVPIDNTVSHEFKRTIPAGGKARVVFTMKALQAGEVQGEFDFCIDTDYDFKSVLYRQIVLPAAASGEEAA